jgi:hypothetical protein
MIALDDGDEVEGTGDRVEGPTLDSVGRLVTDAIGTIDGVTRTTTCLAVSLA